MRTHSISTLCAGLFFLGIILSGGASACQILERSFYTDTLGREEHYLVLLPSPGISITGTVYFLHGRGGNRYFIRDLGACAEIDRLANEQGKSLMVVAPDGASGYWVNGAHTKERYRDLVTNDLIKHVETEFYLVPRGMPHRVLAGISMGGHGAIQIALNSPGVFGSIGAHSPVFRTEAETSKDFSLQFGNGLDYQSRDPFSLINIQGKRITVPVYIDMGAQDPWLRNTLNFQTLLNSLGVPGVRKVGTDSVGGHANAYWHYHLSEYFNWYYQKLR